MADNFGTTPAPTWTGSMAEQARISAFLTRVYGWMFAGLAITAAVAFAVATTPSFAQAIWGNRFMFWILFAGELGLVWYLSARITQLAPGAAGGLFALYSGLNGITLSIILLAYTGASIATAFLTTSAMFGALALYGTVAKRSLAGVGQFAFMGLIGIIVASIVGIFWQNDMLQFVISVCGVVVFTGLTMWDAQRLKGMALQLEGAQAASYAVVGALALYLDFVNLFIMLLRLFGRRR
jgi:FtsH-binding integral membrane protein